MKENKCNIIKDILPLYVENIVSEDTKSFIEDHIKKCEDCKNELNKLETNNLDNVSNSEAEFSMPLKSIKRKLQISKTKIIALTIFLTLIVIVAAYGVLTTPIYLPYSDNLIKTTSIDDNYLNLTFDTSVTNYKIWKIDGKFYDLELWSTPLDKLFKIKSEMPISVTVPKEISTLHYLQNNGDLDVLIYKNPNYSLEYEGKMSLPHLVLNSYFLLMAFGFIVFTIFTLILFILKKDFKIKNIFIRLTILPLSYVITSLITTGLDATTYNSVRDFQLIVCLTCLIAVFLEIVYSVLKPFIFKANQFK